MSFTQMHNLDCLRLKKKQKSAYVNKSFSLFRVDLPLSLACCDISISSTVSRSPL